MSHHKPDEKKKAPEMKDVEGSRLRPKASEKDVEGSRMKPKTTEKDVEGHNFFVDPHSARQMTRDRSAEIERAMRDRARAKEARPNKQHQG